MWLKMLNIFPIHFPTIVLSTPRAIFVLLLPWVLLPDGSKALEALAVREDNVTEHDFMSPVSRCLHVSDGCPYVIDRVAMQHTDTPNQPRQLRRPTVTGKNPAALALFFLCWLPDGRNWSLVAFSPCLLALKLPECLCTDGKNLLLSAF